MTPLFKRIARELVTPELTAAEVSQIDAWLGTPRGVVADLGCAWGRHAALMVRPGRDVIGVDIDGSYRAELHANDVTPLHASFADLTEDDGPIDAAYSWQNSLFCCTPDETLASLRGIARAMRPGGKLLLQNTSRGPTAAVVSPVATFRGVTQRATWDEVQGRFRCTLVAAGEEPDAFDIYCLTREQMTTTLDAAGFDVVRFEDDGNDTLTLAVRRGRTE